MSTEDLVGFYNNTVNRQRHLDEWNKLKELVAIKEKKPEILNTYEEFIRDNQPDTTGYTDDEIINLLKRFKDYRQPQFQIHELQEIMKKDIVLYKYIVSGGSSVDIDPYIKVYLDKIQTETNNNVSAIFANSQQQLQQAKTEVNMQAQKEQKAIDTLDKNSFFSADLMKDKNNATVAKDNIAKTTKPIKMVNSNDSRKEFVIKQIMRAFLPEATAVTYGVRHFTGFDVTSKLSGREWVTAKENRDKLLTTNLDENLIWKWTPDIAMSIAKRINSRPVKLAASATPWLTTTITNIKERGNPFVFNNETKEMDILAYLYTLIPLIKEIATPFVQKLFQIDTQSFATPINGYIEDLNNPDRYKRLEQQLYQQPRIVSHIKQPTAILR